MGRHAVVERRPARRSGRQEPSAAVLAGYANAIPLARYRTPEEIAQSVGFLCDPAASDINGQRLAGDGGFDAAGMGPPSLHQIWNAIVVGAAYARVDWAAGRFWGWKWSKNRFLSSLTVIFRLRRCF